MKWEAVETLTGESFRRLTGVKRATFEKMIELLSPIQQENQSRGGRKPLLRIEEKILMTLEYLREYRTYFHISKSYGVSESNAYKIIRWVEDHLIKSRTFRLPGRKALLKSDVHYEVVLVDATETPVQRPKKNRNTMTQEKRSATR